MKRIYDIYIKPVKSAFAGRGEEWLIVHDGVILKHGRGWDNPQVVDDNFKDHLTGKPAKERGRGWRKLTGFKAENAQPWARDMVAP